MLQTHGTLISNLTVAAGYRLAVVSLPEISSQAQPGQFLHLKCGTGPFPLLRRPVSIHRVHRPSGQVSMLYEIKGAGTRWLAERQPEDELDVIGPLGNGFSLPADRLPLMLVAGGIGVAPLVFLAEEALSLGYPVQVLVGSRHKAAVLGEAELRQLGAGVEVATDDGSHGYHGLVTDLLEPAWNRVPAARVFACGPAGMMSGVAAWALKRQVPCFISLEERMACGVGACRGCVVKLRDAEGGHVYQNVCSAGPVFDAREVAFHAP